MLCVMKCPLTVIMISFRYASTVVRRKLLVRPSIGANKAFHSFLWRSAPRITYPNYSLRLLKSSLTKHQ